MKDDTRGDSQTVEPEVMQVGAVREEGVSETCTRKEKDLMKGMGAMVVLE